MALWGMLDGLAVSAVQINEVLASNGQTLMDEDGDYPDWIELYNPGAEAADISGWGLSDDDALPLRWTFPEGVSVPAGGYLLVWASGKDRRPVGPSSGLHTDFSISSAGEPVLLASADGVVVDYVPPVALPRDVSVGRVVGMGDAWYFFDTPTPDAPNTTTPYLGVLDPPEFSHAGGRYPEPITLTLSAEEGATILYSLDGSVPTADEVDGVAYPYKYAYPGSAGSEPAPMLYREVRSYEYAEPIALIDRSAQSNELATINTWFNATPRLPSATVPKGSVVRARTVREGYLPSGVVTHSYFVGADDTHHGDLMVLSLVADERSLFDYEAGIYVPGAPADQWRLNNPQAVWPPEVVPANYHLRGPDWERDAYLEGFLPNGDRAFAQNVGMRIHGAFSRGFYRKSLRIYARSEYDAPSAIPYGFFPGLMAHHPSRPVDSFRRLLLRNSGGDYATTLIRDAFIQSLVRHVPIDQQQYRPAVKYINGEYWGIINIRERLDQHYLASHYDVDPDDVVILAWNSSVDTGLPGDQNHFLETVQYAIDHDLSLSAHYDWMATRMDLDNFLQYAAIQTYIANEDWLPNNHDFWRKRTDGYVPDAPPGHDGRWRWMLYDTEASFAGWQASRNMLQFLAGGQASFVDLFNNLLANSAFRNAYINAVADHMNTSFRYQRVEQKLAEINAPIESERSRHGQRWQSGTSRGDTIFLPFAAQRPAHKIEHVVNHFGLPGHAELVLVTDPEKGVIRLNGMTVDETMIGHPSPDTPYPWNGIYFQGVPIRLEAVPRDQQRFMGWHVRALPDGESEFYSDEASIEPVLTGDTEWTAAFESVPMTEWSWPIHEWTFDEGAHWSAPSYTVGGGLLQVEASDTAEAIINEVAQEFDSSHLRINNPTNAVLILHLPTRNYGQLVLEYDTRRSGQGAGEQLLEYTFDGMAWHELARYAVDDAAPQAQRWPLDEMPGAEDNDDFAIRISFEQGEGGGLGNNRFDNIRLTGVGLPGANLPPVVLLPITVQGLIEGEDDHLITLHDHFADPNDDVLNFVAESDNPVVLAVRVEDGVLSMQALHRGEATVTVSADDGEYAPVSASFRVLVYPAPYALAGAEYTFTTWSAAEPAGSFPPHMLFVQGEEDDATLSTSLNRAYHIPLDDAALPGDVAYSYAADSHTRLTGLNEAGIAFINTGRGRDLGGALLALDTRNVTRASVEWTGGTVLANSREYAIRLQYRIGHDGPFVDLLDHDDQVIEYQRHESNGHVVNVGPVSLPVSLLGQPCVQLLWRYHWMSGESGPRAQLRLDDIRVIDTSDIPFSFADWQEIFFSEEELEQPEVAGPLADPDNTGIPNLLRYAWALSRDDDVTDTLRLHTDDGRIMLSLIRLHQGGDDITYTIMGIENLADRDGWRPLEKGVDVILVDSVIEDGENREWRIYEIPLEGDEVRSRMYGVSVTLWPLLDD